MITSISYPLGNKIKDIQFKKLNIVISESNTNTEEFMDIMKSINRKSLISNEIKYSPVKIYINYRNKYFVCSVYKDQDDGMMRIIEKEDMIDDYRFVYLAYDNMFNFHGIEESLSRDDYISCINGISFITGLDIIKFETDKDGMYLLSKNADIIYISTFTPLYYTLLSIILLHCGETILIDENIIRSGGIYMHRFYYALVDYLKNNDKQVFIVWRDEFSYLLLSHSLIDFNFNHKDGLYIVFTQDNDVIEYMFFPQGAAGSLLERQFFTYRVNLATNILQKRNEIMKNVPVYTKGINKEIQEIIDKMNEYIEKNNL